MQKRKIKIGIPKGLFYYRYFPFWKNFFENLECEVIVSKSTDKEILSKGISLLTDEICLPVKAFCGQVVSLIEKCDFILIPSIFSFEKKVHACPKFIGLPDLIKAVVPEAKILDPDINFDRGEKDFYFNLLNLGKIFKKDDQKIKRAIERAKEAQKEFEEREEKVGKEKFLVALIGHPYLIRDEFLTKNLVFHLEKNGAKVLFSDSIPYSKMRSYLLKMNPKPYWSCEDEIIGAGAYLLEKKNVDGMILVSAFGCGPDSTMFSILKIRAEKMKIPLLEIFFDEHTSDAGLVTRIEAFLDTLSREKRKDSLFPIREKVFEGKIKKIGFPCLGGGMKVLRKILKRNFGISLVVLPVTERTYELGVKYAPETICFPFKVILGNSIEFLERGVDTLMMTTARGPCRIGYYHNLLEEILRDLGYDFEIFRMRGEIIKERGIFEVFRMIKRFTGKASWSKIISTFLMAIFKLRAYHKLEREVQKVRAVEIEKGTADRIFEEAIEAIDEAEGFFQLRKILKKYLKKLKEIPKMKEKPLKIGLIGEIFVLMEPFVNMEIEKELGKMGCEVERVKSSYLGEYTNPFIRFDPLTHEKKKLEKFTKKYLKRDIGGHALESIGKKVEWSKKFDGLIHIMPFGCLPEVIAQNIMMRMPEKIPVLTVPCDEKMAKAGLITRLEAFVDLIKNKKYENVLRN